MKTWTGLALAALLVAAPVYAETVPPRKSPGQLRVDDKAGLFTKEGIATAQEKFRETSFDRGLKVTVETYREVPQDRLAAAEAAKGDREKWRKFMESWVKERAQALDAEGIFIIIVEQPTGGIEGIARRQTRVRGFTDQDESTLRQKFAEKFRMVQDADAAAKRTGHDAGLQSAIDFIINDLKDTVVEDKSGTTASKSEEKASGRGIGGWICIGLCVLLGVWLVIGLIRAFTSPPGYYGGGGGGGFGASLLGGLFGAMAGMWLYNSMFSGGGMFGGSDAHASDAGTGTDGDTGAGDWSGESGGGDWGGGGDFGGGDFGGDF